MKLTSPLRCGLLLCALLQLYFVQNALSQGTLNSGLTLRVTVNGVATDFGEFECGYGTADFGDSIVTDVCGPAQWAHDINGLDSLVCDSIPAGSLTGKIALVRRGGCPVAAAGNFTAKAENAQKAGALAVLIANHSANATETDCFSRQLFGPAPAVHIPVLFLSRVVANFIDAAINSGSTVEICLKRPNVFIQSAFYPLQNLQTPVSQIAQDTLGFSANLTNVRGVNLSNVQLKAFVENATTGDVIFSTTLTIPTLDASVVDSQFVLPDLFVPDLPIGNYRITYATESDPPAESFKDRRRIGNFNVTEKLFAKDLAMPTSSRPSPLPEDGWGLGNLYMMTAGSLDHYEVRMLEFGYASNPAEVAPNEVAADLFLFELKDTVVSDWSLFDRTAFFSNSFELKGTGSYIAPSDAESFQYHNVEMVDLGTAAPGVAIQNGKSYIAAAFYTGDSKYAFNGMDEIEPAGPNGINTITYSDQWYLGGFSGAAGAVLRMYIDLLVTTDEKPLPDSYMKVFPNPARDVINLGLNLEKPTDVTVTIADLNGRTIQIQDRFGLTNETLTYQLPQLASGTYLARIATKEGTLTKKFIVQK